jgi:hypothetical protein
MDKTNSLFKERFKGRIHYFKRNFNPIMSGQGEVTLPKLSRPVI